MVRFARTRADRTIGACNPTPRDPDRSASSSSTPTSGSGRAWPGCCASATSSCVVGSAGETDPAIDVVLATEPDIVVIDPRLPEPDAGLTFIHRLRAVAPGVRILVMSGTDPSDQADLVGAADGFIRKTFRPSDLVAAVIAAAVPLAG